MHSGLKSVFAATISFGALLACSGETVQTASNEAAAPAATQVDWSQGAPDYRVDIDWPKPLPNKWLMQSVTGMHVDKDDNIWVLNRPDSIGGDETNAEKTPPVSECCVRPPAVMKFNKAGDLLASWGGTGYVPGWPQNEHTIFTDNEGNVWIAGSQAGDSLLKFTADGKLISDFGHRGQKFDGPASGQKQNNQQTELLLRGVANAELDEAAGEIYVADGYLNKRVMVFDLATGAFKRGWGAYGTPLDKIGNEPTPPHNPAGPPLKEYRPSVHCVQISNDNLVYVCDRGGNRVQVFTKQGEFQKEFIVANDTLERGTAGMVSFSPDPEQRFLFLADIQNSAVWILNRQTGEVAGRFGRRGYGAGEMMLMHLAVADSEGNVYTGEVGDAGRVQKFRPVPKGSQQASR